MAYMNGVYRLSQSTSSSSISDLGLSWRLQVLSLVLFCHFTCYFMLFLYLYSTSDAFLLLPSRTDGEGGREHFYFSFYRSSWVQDHQIIVQMNDGT